MMEQVKPKVLAYYFPNWHSDPRNDVWHGPGWTEWEVAKCARPRFTGHRQPKVPVWGYEDEARPEVMARKIEAAVAHGVDGFIFDWYWFEDGGYRLRCIDEGFLQASNCQDVKFAVMWCNHDPIFVHPASSLYPCPSLLSGDLSLGALFRGTNYCIEHYLGRPNYLRDSRGRLYFCFYLPDKLIKNLGGPEGLKCFVRDFRRRVREAGLGDLDLSAILENVPGYRTDPAAADALAREIGFDSFTTHARVKDESLPFPHCDYEKCIAGDIANFAIKTSQTSLPYNINISSGFDSSPRTVQSDIYGPYGCMYGRIINNNTPELFEKCCRAARDFAASGRMTGEYITIYSWNEWTEGGYLEPDTEYGYGFLEAIERVFKAPGSCRHQ